MEEVIDAGRLLQPGGQLGEPTPVPDWRGTKYLRYLRYLNSSASARAWGARLFRLQLRWGLKLTERHRLMARERGGALENGALLSAHQEKSLDLSSSIPGIFFHLTKSSGGPLEQRPKLCNYRD